jgi:hypothetical protein
VAVPKPARPPVNRVVLGNFGRPQPFGQDSVVHVNHSCHLLVRPEMPSEQPPDPDLFNVLSGISIAGPDADNVLWITFNANGGHATLSVKAGTADGDTVARWREMQSAALTKAIRKGSRYAVQRMRRSGHQHDTGRLRRARCELSPLWPLRDLRHGHEPVPTHVAH